MVRNKFCTIAVAIATVSAVLYACSPSAQPPDTLSEQANSATEQVVGKEDETNALQSCAVNASTLANVYIDEVLNNKESIVESIQIIRHKETGHKACFKLEVREWDKNPYYRYLWLSKTSLNWSIDSIAGAEPPLLWWNQIPSWCKEDVEFPTTDPEYLSDGNLYDFEDFKFYNEQKYFGDFTISQVKKGARYYYQLSGGSIAIRYRTDVNFGVYVGNGQSEVYFDWRTPRQDHPYGRLADIDGDGDPELFLQVLVGQGTGMQLYETHILDPKTLKEYPIQDYTDQVLHFLAGQDSQSYRPAFDTWESIELSRENPPRLKLCLGLSEDGGEEGSFVEFLTGDFIFNGKYFQLNELQLQK